MTNSFFSQNFSAS